MKEYYLYDSDFRDLERTGAFAASLLAVATGCFGFAVNAWVGLALSESLSPALKSEWTNYRNIAIWIGAICFLFSILLTFSGYNRVEELKAQTSHGAETYQPRSRFLIAIYAVVLLVTLGVGILVGSFFFSSGG